LTQHEKNTVVTEGFSEEKSTLPITPKQGDDLSRNGVTIYSEICNQKPNVRIAKTQETEKLEIGKSTL
jgi:hypothetical protein